MRWIEAPLLMPLHPRRAWLRSCWLVTTAILGLACGGILALPFGLAGMVTGIMTGCFVGALGWMAPSLATRPYRWWHRASDFYGRTLRLIIKAVMFFVILAAGRQSSSLQLARPFERASVWVPRRTLPSANYPHEDERVMGPAAVRAWPATYLTWARASGRRWAFSLLPFLLLLSLLEPEQERTVSAQTYTLF